MSSNNSRADDALGQNKTATVIVNGRSGEVSGKALSCLRAFVTTAQ